jgi:hypothetical protein
MIREKVFLLGKALICLFISLNPINVFSQENWKNDFKYQELNSRPGLEVRYVNGERDAFEIIAADYQLTGQLLPPNLLLDSGTLKPWLFFEISDHKGNVYYSQKSGAKTRINLYRRGPYYCEIHWFDLTFTDQKGNTIPAKTEVVLYCYPEKVKASIKLFPSSDFELKAIAVKGKMETSLLPKSLIKDQPQYFNFDIFGESKPLPDQAFELIKGKTQVGYDHRKGAYTIGSETAEGFQQQYFDQPNGYEEVTFKVRNDGSARKIYICQKTLKGEGIVEGGVVLDEEGHPLPILVQVSKNFDGEKEEKFYNPKDTAFSETFFPLYLEPYEELEISSLHLYQNWGRHMTKHWLSLGFFMDYFHSSTGVTETTCYIPFKFGHKTGISIGDFRAMSQETFWSGQPQHDNVAGHSFLTYFDGKQWNYSEYRGTTYKSTGANWCNVEMEYRSTDGCIQLLLDIWEVPQDDEVRSFFTARYRVLKPLIIEDAKANFRFLDISTSQQSLRYTNYAYTDAAGKTISHPIDFNQSPFCEKGIEIPSENSFAAVFGEPKGSNGIMVRSFKSNTGVKPAFSIQQKTHIPEPKDTTVNEHKVYTPDLGKGDIRFSLVPSSDRLVLKPGDEITVSGFWLPYGEINGVKTPSREIIAFGKDQPRITAIEKGFAISDLPTTIQLENNEAQFTLKGGLNVLPIIATGLSSYLYPALYKKVGDDWQLVHQDHNNPLDGMQLFCDRDGKFGTVFLVRTNGETHQFKIVSGAKYQNASRMEIRPKPSRRAQVAITNPFEKQSFTLNIDHQAFADPIKWNESAGQSFWFINRLKDTLSGARVTGFEEQLTVQYWWQNTRKENMVRSPEFELQLDANIFSGKYQAFYYRNGQLSECQNLKNATTFECDELSYGVKPGIIVLYQKELDYCIALAFKDAASVSLRKNSIAVRLSKQNCPDGRRKVMEGKVYLLKGNPAKLQGIIENELPVWKPGLIQTSGLIPVSDHDPLHALGNGKMCIYQKGADIVTAYTGPYSTPSFLRLDWIRSEQTVANSTRQSGTAVWSHKLTNGSVESAELTDFVDAESPCFIRKIKTNRKITFRLNLENYVQVIDNSNRLNAGQSINGRLMVVPPGTTIYQTYVYPRLLYCQLLTSGNAQIIQSEGLGNIDITCEPGESVVYLIGGPEYPDLMNNIRQVLDKTPDVLLSRTVSYWDEFTKKRKDFAGILPETTPSRSKLLQTIDDVAVLLKTQQSIQGAVLAGYPYPLGYVRDQYGVSRGFLALGLNDEAKSILNFYWQIWKKYGFIHNAQAIGVDGIFHIHENDEVESTGYLILQAFDLMNATHDKAFMTMIAPMLDWAFNCQKKWLVNDMLPFNGDETYVAGGMLPRSALNDGSAEATMLFIECGQKYLDWVKAENRWNNEVIVENLALIARVKSNFQTNFWRNGTLWTNNPERASSANLPQFRHGVCEAAGPNCLMGKYQGIVWTGRNENGRYVCASCNCDDLLPRAEPTSYNLLSVALSPFYMNFSIMPYTQLKPAVMQILNKRDEPRTVGYDYGFLLNALTKLQSPEAAAIYDKTLSVSDQTGAWAEYYLNDKPYGTRYRPWESAINLEALIDFAMMKKITL